MFKVYLIETITKEETICVCKTRQELSDLILHLDAEHYDITKIIVDSIIYEDYKTFLKRDPNLEMGLNKNK